MAPGAVDGDPQQVGATAAPELGQDLVVQGHLVAADRTPVGRIEGQNYRPAGKSFSDTVWSGVDRKLKSGAAVPACKYEPGSTFEA